MSVWYTTTIYARDGVRWDSLSPVWLKRKHVLFLAIPARWLLAFLSCCVCVCAVFTCALLFVYKKKKRGQPHTLFSGEQINIAYIYICTREEPERERPLTGSFEPSQTSDNFYCKIKKEKWFFFFYKLSFVRAMNRQQSRSLRSELQVCACVCTSKWMSIHPFARTGSGGVGGAREEPSSEREISIS